MITEIRGNLLEHEAWGTHLFPNLITFSNPLKCLYVSSSFASLKKPTAVREFEKMLSKTVKKSV
jgi:hypothetical protein